MEEQLAEAKGIHEAAKGVDYEGLNLERRMNENKPFMDFMKKNENKFSDSALGVYAKLEKEGLPKEYTEETVRPLILKADLKAEGITVDQKQIELAQKITKDEMELQSKYGRKDGNGLVKPKNNREEWEQRTLHGKWHVNSWRPFANR